MKNKKNKKWSGFFTNLLGVILGITLTFGVNSLWQKHEEKKKTREILTLVRKELETNKKWFKNQEKYLKRDNYAFKKLFEEDKNLSTIHQDSLQFYLNSITSYQLGILTISAWEILQNSETIQKISNKELVIWLTNCYYEINTLYDFLMKNYWDKKWQIIEQIIYIASSDYDEMYEFIEALMIYKESFFFLHTFIENFSENIFLSVDAHIDYTLFLLDEYGDFQYVYDTSDNKYDSFMKARNDSLSIKNDTIVK